MDQNNPLGAVVKSKSGRDKDRYFLVVGIIDSEYVYISDGSLRKVDKPKKKKIKHLVFIDHVEEEISGALKAGKKVSNAALRKFLQSMDAYKEV